MPPKNHLSIDIQYQINTNQTFLKYKVFILLSNKSHTKNIKIFRWFFFLLLLLHFVCVWPEFIVQAFVSIVVVIVSLFKICCRLVIIQYVCYKFHTNNILVSKISYQYHILNHSVISFNIQIGLYFPRFYSLSPFSGCALPKICTTKKKCSRFLFFFGLLPNKSVQLCCKCVLDSFGFIRYTSWKYNEKTTNNPGQKVIHVYLIVWLFFSLSLVE